MILELEFGLCGESLSLPLGKYILMFNMRKGREI